jgi:transcriptional regulator with XRE-family HTH domain
MPRKKLSNRSVKPSDVEIGLRLRVMRTDKHLSQSELGEKLGVTFQQVQKYERGINRLSLSRAVQVASILGTSLDQLAGSSARVTADGATFDLARYKLAQSFDGLDDEIATSIRRLVETIKKDTSKKR